MMMETDCEGYSNKAKLWGLTYTEVLKLCDHGPLGVLDVVLCSVEKWDSSQKMIRVMLE